MATPIDQLNFKVILNDTDFRTRINEDIASAERLNTTLGKVVQVKSKQIITSAGVKNAQQMSQYLDQIATKIRTMPKGQFLIGDADRLNSTLAETNKRLDQIIAKSQKAGQGMGVTGKNLTRAWMRFSSTLWSVISAIRLFTNTFGAAIKNISAFQQANANLATIMQVSRKEIETLTNDALMLGRTTEWTASQVTELQTALAKLGYDMPQIRNMQASVLQFATAVGAKLPDAANLAGASLRMFGMHSSEMQKALEILAASTNKTALDFEKLKVSLPYVGAIAHSIGFDIAQTASLLGVLTNAGLESSRAGTGLRQVLLELSKTNGKLQTAMGGNVKSFDDFVNGLQAMRDRGLQAGEATKLVSTRASSALLILANGVDTIKKLNDEVRDTDGLLKDIQSERLDTLHGSALLLKSAWEGLIQTFRDSAGPMKDLVDWLTKIVRWMSLAESRANRIAQGTNNGFWGGWAARPGLWAKGVTGSDELTKTYEDMFDRLVEQGHSIEDATRLVNEQMRQRERDLRKEFGLKEGEQPKNLEESWWFRRFSKNATTGFFTNLFTQGTQAKSEQMEAMSNTFDAVGDYMETRSKEDAEIAANAWLEEWKAIFDAEGEDAARAAMSKVASSEVIDKMKQQMEGYIANGGAAGAQERGKGKTQKEINQELISDLKAEATYIRKLYDDYTKLVPLLGEEGAAKKMSEILDGGDYSKESLEQGILAITDSLKKLGDEGEDAAREILRSWGLDKFSRVLKELQSEKNAAEDAQKALDKYLDALEDWASKNQDLSGTGATYNVSKAIATYRKAIADANKKGKSMLGSLMYGTSDNEERLLGFANINEQWAKSGANALVTLRNSITNLADDIIKEQLEKGGFDLTNFNDKTLAQLNDLKSAIEDIELPDEVKALLKDYPELLKALEDEIAKLKQAKVDKTVDPERWKKIAKQAKYIAERFLSVSESLKEFADASGNTALSDAASRIGALAQNIKAAEEGYKVFGGWWGAVIGGGADLIEQVLEGLTATEREARELRDAVRDIRRETEEQSFKDALLDGVDGAFGENFVKRLKNAVGLLDDIRMKVKALEYTKPERNWLGAYDEKDLVDWERWNALRNGNPGDMPFVTNHSWLTGNTTRTLEQLAKEFNLEITDKNGLLNPTLLQAIIDKYGELNEGAIDWLTDSIRYAKEYEEALQQIEDATKDIFDNLASDMADKFIDNYIKMGNAVDDLSATFADLGDAILRSFLQSYIIDEILAKYKDEAKNALTKYSTGDMTPEDYANWLEGFASNVQKESEALAPAINGMIEAFKDRGLMNIDEDTANSVGSGFKSITEDQAGLLASYLNAIRADVSVMRGLQEKGWGVINTLGTSLPTLNDYLAQIAATNFDIAQSNQSILSELQSVIGSPGTSGMVVRVEYA